MVSGVLSALRENDDQDFEETVELEAPHPHTCVSVKKEEGSLLESSRRFWNAFWKVWVPAAVILRILISIGDENGTEDLGQGYLGLQELKHLACSSPEEWWSQRLRGKPDFLSLSVSDSSLSSKGHWLKVPPAGRRPEVKDYVLGSLLFPWVSPSREGLDPLLAALPSFLPLSFLYVDCLS